MIKLFLKNSFDKLKKGDILSMDSTFNAPLNNQYCKAFLGIQSCLGNAMDSLFEKEDEDVNCNDMACYK